MQYLAALAMGTTQRVDRAKRIVYGVAIATKGPAAGHGEHVDDESLNQIVVLGNRGSVHGTLRARMDHPPDREKQAKTLHGPLHKLLGTPKDFRRDGNTVRADIHLLSLAAAPLSDQFMSLAEESPATLGASLVFAGTNDKNGAVRFLEVYAVDFVDFPATNPNGLFAAVPPGVQAVRDVLDDVDKRKAQEEDDARLRLAERFREAERALEQRKAGDAAARKEWENSRAKRVSLGVPETARPGDPVYEAGWDRYLAAERKYREVPTV